MGKKITKPKEKTAKPIIHKVEYIKITQLKNHPENYRLHGEDQREHIEASLKAEGFYKNVVVADDYTLLAGHGVIEAAKSLKIDQIPVVRLKLKPNSVRALKILTGDNEISKLGIVDDRKLSEILKQISDDGDLMGTGLDKMMLANLVMVTRHAHEIKDFDAAAEWVGMPEYDEDDPTFQNEPTLVISFKNPEDRERFIKEYKIKIREKRTEKKWTTIWPYQERHDLKSVKFEDVEK